MREHRLQDVDPVRAPRRRVVRQAIVLHDVTEGRSSDLYRRKLGWSRRNCWRTWQPRNERGGITARKVTRSCMASGAGRRAHLVAPDGRERSC